MRILTKKEYKSDSKFVIHCKKTFSYFVYFNTTYFFVNIDYDKQRSVCITQVRISIVFYRFSFL